jgi:hypothetical protein
MFDTKNKEINHGKQSENLRSDPYDRSKWTRGSGKELDLTAGQR